MNNWSTPHQILIYYIFLHLSSVNMSWIAKLGKADQAGFRMFKCIMTGGALGLVGRELYVQFVWVSQVSVFVCCVCMT